jgi:saccharopine dehydrogenase-like NADP-dependent oxidoreductase
MKYCIMGAGQEGSAMATILARDSDVESIVLADRDTERAERVAQKIGSDKITAKWVDASDMRSLVTAARGSDVVLCLIEFVWAEHVRKAALEVGCHCVDPASEPSFQEDIAFKHFVHQDEEFRRAGLCGVACCGWAPGVTNVLVRHAYDRLDEVDSVKMRFGHQATAWVDPNAIIHPWLPHSSPETILRDYAVKPLHFTNGRPTHVEPFSNGEVYDFGGKVGVRQLAMHDHDEPYTIPALLGKGIKEFSFKYAVNDQVGTFVAMGMADPERVVELRDGTRVKPFDVLLACVRQPIEENIFADREAIINTDRTFDRAVVIETTGRSDGVNVRDCLSWYLPDTSETRARNLDTWGTSETLIALPMIQAVKMISSGQVPKGVSTPEQLDPDVFLGGLREMGYPLDFKVERVELGTPAV